MIGIQFVCCAKWNYLFGFLKYKLINLTSIIINKKNCALTDHVKAA